MAVALSSKDMVKNRRSFAYDMSWAFIQLYQAKRSIVFMVLFIDVSWFLLF